MRSYFIAMGFAVGSLVVGSSTQIKSRAQMSKSGHEHLHVRSDSCKLNEVSDRKGFRRKEPNTEEPKMWEDWVESYLGYIGKENRWRFETIIEVRRKGFLTRSTKSRRALSRDDHEFKWHLQASVTSHSQRNMTNPSKDESKSETVVLGGNVTIAWRADTARRIAYVFPNDAKYREAYATLYSIAESAATGMFDERGREERHYLSIPPRHVKNGRIEFSKEHVTLRWVTKTPMFGAYPCRQENSLTIDRGTFAPIRYLLNQKDLEGRGIEYKRTVEFLTASTEDLTFEPPEGFTLMAPDDDPIWKKTRSHAALLESLEGAPPFGYRTTR